MTRNQAKPRTVYFLRQKGVDGPVKIGCSQNLPDRFRKLDAWSPVPLEVIAQFLGNLDIEHRLHSYFEQEHIRHEWFAWSPRVAEAVASINAGSFDVSVLPERKFVGLRKAMREWADAAHLVKA